MTYDQVISTIMFRVGNRPTLRPQIEAELQMGIETELERDAQFKPWFLLVDGFQDLTIVADTRTIAWPSEFLAENEMGSLWIEAEGGALTLLTKLDIKVLVARVGETATGTPTHYTVIGTKIHLYPKPTDGGTIKALYYAQSGFEKNDDANVWIKYASDWLIGHTASKIAESIQNLQIFQLEQARAQRARLRVMGESEEFAETNVNTLMGDL